MNPYPFLEGTARAFAMLGGGSATPPQPEPDNQTGLWFGLVALVAALFFAVTRP